MGNEMTGKYPNCAACRLLVAKRACKYADGTGIEGCPTLEATQVLQRANEAYADPEVLAFTRAASLPGAACYGNQGHSTYEIPPRKDRMEEIIKFANRMEYNKLGLAFCAGLRSEAEVVHKLITKRGFDLVSAICKSGRTDKTFLGLKDHEKIRSGGPESMCNPIYQAELLNEAGTQLNILLGLCVGHDSLFFKYANAPCTVLAAKDRVTGHNPLVPIYQIDSYYQKLKHPELDEEV